MALPLFLKRNYNRGIMKTVLAGGTLIDGTGSPSLKNGSVVFEDGTITEAGPSDSVNVPKDAIVYNVNGKTIIPGLIDCHIHMDLHGFGNTFDENLVEDKLRTIRAAKEMETTLCRGITTARNVGSRGGIDFAVKQAIHEGLSRGPTILTSGKIISMTTSGNDYFWGLYREADGPDEVRKAAREQLKAGADFLKIMDTGAVMNPGEVPGASQFSRDEIKAVVEEADKVGRAVAAHAHGVEGIQNAILGGVRTVEHGTLMDEETIDLFLEHDVFLVPTPVVGYCMRSKSSEIAPFMRDKIERMKSRFKEMLSIAIERGVKIAFGTDAGTPFNYHGNNALQLKLYVDDGFFSPVEAVHIATQVAAEVVERADTVGTIERAKTADIVVVDGSLEKTVDPLLDSVAVVIQKGEVVYSAGGPA
jgi:imidazolonepropionase-like amidohydrolase